MRSLLCSFLFLAPLGALGCATSEPPPARPANEDQPRAFSEARRLEDQAIKSVKSAHQTRDVVKRQEFYDLALAQLRDARKLYEDELIRDPGTPERRRAIEAEMDRLSERIRRLHEERPHR